MAGCSSPIRGTPAPAPAPGSGVHDEADTVGARGVFDANIDAIHRRDRARYLSLYLHDSRLIRNGPGGVETGFEGWSARRDSTWPDTLIARELRLFPLAPGIVYGTYHYRVTQGGETTEGISERVFLKTDDGWKIAVSTAFGSPDEVAPPPLALVGGTLVNPGVAAVPNAVVVIRHGRVACAGERGVCAIPTGIEIVDITGAYISPGLVDAHVHFSQTGWVDGRPDALDVRATLPYDSIVGSLRDDPERFGRAYLCSGVTAVFDVGGYPWTFDLASRSRSARHLPLIVAAGPLLSTIDHWVNLPTMRQFIFMRDDSTVRATVQAQARMGAAAIKVWYLQLPDSIQRRMKPLLLAVGDEARKVGLPLIVHATQLATARDAVEAGAAVLVHSVETGEIDDDLVAAMKRTHTIVIPTLTVREGYADVFLGRSPGSRYPLDCVDPATREKLERVLPEAMRARGLAIVRSGTWDRQRATTERNLAHLRAGGIPIAMGTDAGNPGTAHGPSVFREMEAMQTAGMPASEVFASATIVAARAMRADRDIGTIQPGKRADLVVLDGDPTADIRNARRTRLVVRGGVLYARAELLPRPSRRHSARGR
ncbi:MAG: hypothetical protein NVS4B3_10770 [Gemmatimonadaceae bacterium]